MTETVFEQALRHTCNSRQGGFSTGIDTRQFFAQTWCDYIQTTKSLHTPSMHLILATLGAKSSDVTPTYLEAFWIISRGSISGKNKVFVSVSLSDTSNKYF